MAVRVLPVPSREFAEPRLHGVRQAIVVGSTANLTNAGLATALGAAGLAARVVPPERLLGEARDGDLVLNRVDVLPTLDGPCAGLWETAAVERSGAVLLNHPRALYLAHDKLATATVLVQAGLPHPSTMLVQGIERMPGLQPPYVVKPRFGSWGRDVFLCRDESSLADVLVELSSRSWFGRHGVLVQELIGPARDDLRVVVATGAVVGAVSRVAGPGEWRTNVAAGGRRVRATPCRVASTLALRAVAALGLDFAGVDLMRDGNGEWVVLEVNGAVDFTEEYALDGTSVFGEVAERLALWSVRDDSVSQTFV
jgi:RimK family alpha-L-glutamate ligase